MDQATQRDTMEASGNPRTLRFVRVRHDRATWEIATPHRDAVLGSSAPDWFDLETDPRARAVKAGHRRRVWRVATASGVFYCKVIEPRQPSVADPIAAGEPRASARADTAVSSNESAPSSGVGFIRRTIGRLLDLVLASPAMREWRKTIATAERGVPMPRPVALGVERGGRRRAVLISEAVEPSALLSEAWERPSARPTLIRAIAELLAHAHDRGFVHHDGHPGNVLVRETGARLQACFVDVHTGSVGHGPVGFRAAVGALGTLDHYFERVATRTERARFLRAYLGVRVGASASMTSASRCGMDRATTRCWITAIRHAARTQGVRLAWQRDRRLRRDGRYFGKLKLAGGWQGTVVLALERRHVFPEKDVPDFTVEAWHEALARWLGKTSDEGVETGAAPCVTRYPCGGTEIALVPRHERVLSQRVGALLVGTNARRAFERAHRLRHRDIAAPLVLGCLERRSFGMPDASVLILRVRNS